MIDTNTTGTAQALLIAQNKVFRTAAPQFKLTPAGFLEYCLNNNTPRVLSNAVADGSGYIRDVTVRFLKRGIKGSSTTADDCSFVAAPAYYDQVIHAPLYRQVAILFDYNTIRRFNADSLASVTLPGSTPATTVMMEVVAALQSKLNGLIQDINDDLLGIQAAHFGVNVASGNNAARTVNFPLASTTNNLATGMNQVLAEARRNEIILNGSAIVGSGLIDNYMIQQIAKGFDQSGVNTRLLAMPNYYYDPGTATKWASNDFGVFEKDAVQFINFSAYKGLPITPRFGNSVFGSLQWPLMDSLGSTGLRTLDFDFQIQEKDCPDTENDYAGTPITHGRGVVVTLSCNYYSVNVPADAYVSGDPLYQVNGTLHYNATNA